MEQREKRDLYNILKEKTGQTFYKGDAIPENLYYLIVMIIIQNHNNEFLIQKRSISKGGTWALTGGHPKSGESSLEGIITEVQEEIGLDISNIELNLFETYNTSNQIFDLYYTKLEVDEKKLVLQVEEVSDIKWVTIKEIEEMFTIGIFNKGHYETFQRCLNYLKNIN